MEGIKETEKMKKVKCLVFKEEFHRKSKLWFAFFLSVILSIWCSIPRLYLPSLMPPDISNAFNIIVQSLTFSIIAGIIVYFISEFLPRCQGLYERLSSIADNLFLLNEDIDSIMAVSCEKDKEYSTAFDVKSFVNRILYENISGVPLDNETTAKDFDKEVHFKPEYLFALNLIIDRIDSSLQSMALLSSYLKPGEVVLIPMANSCTLFREVQRRRGFGVSYEMNDLTIRYGLLLKYIYDYKFIRDGINSLTNSYHKYLTLSDNKDTTRE